MQIFANYLLIFLHIPKIFTTFAPDLKCRGNARFPALTVGYP